MNGFLMMEKRNIDQVFIPLKLSVGKLRSLEQNERKYDCTRRSLKKRYRWPFCFPKIDLPSSSPRSLPPFACATAVQIARACLFFLCSRNGPMERKKKLFLITHTTLLHTTHTKHFHTSHSTQLCRTACFFGRSILPFPVSTPDTTCRHDIICKKV
jgi:hypothetical protein